MIYDSVMWCWGRWPVTDTIHRRKKRYITHLAFSWNPHLRFWNKFLNLRFNLRIWTWHRHWEQVAHNPSDSIKYPKWRYACRISYTGCWVCVSLYFMYEFTAPHGAIGSSASSLLTPSPAPGSESHCVTCNHIHYIVSWTITLFWI